MTPLREWGLRRTPAFGHCGFWSPGFRWVFSAVISPWAPSQTLPILSLAKRAPSHSEFQSQVSVKRDREGAPCPLVAGKHCVLGSTTKSI